MSLEEEKEEAELDQDDSIIVDFFELLLKIDRRVNSEEYD